MIKQKKTIKKPMEIEYEARFLDINPDELIKKIKEVGGRLKSPLRIYRRSVFSLCDIKKGFVRVRDEGDKITMTSKIYKNPKFPQEYELELKDSFEHGQAFLRSLNLDEKAYQETMREKWSIIRNNKELCEIAIDRIPALPIYAEVECKSKKDLDRCIKLLDLKKHKISFGGFGKVYAEYYGMSENEINNVIPKLTFQNIREELKTYIHKNHDILEKTFKEHLDVYLEHKKKQ